MKLELITFGVIVTFIALFAYTSLTGNHEWGGADDQPEGVIQKLTHGDFKPWFHNVWVPPSPEIESMLFAVQASIGSIIIGYFLGYYRALAKMKTVATSEMQEGELNA